MTPGAAPGFAVVRPRKLLFMAIDGPAPRGTLERQMERLLRGLSIDEEDDDADI